MLEPSVIAPLADSGAALLRAKLHVFGLVEGEVDQRLALIDSAVANDSPLTIAPNSEIHVTLTAPIGQNAMLEEARTAARQQLGHFVFAESDEDFTDCVVALLKSSKQTLATAESCTGGLVGDLITDIPGSSEIFVGGVVAYSNAVKESLLGVNSQILVEHGAVSEATVLEMARGVKKRLHSDIGLAISGIAGPGGGTPDKPVGTLWFAVVSAQSEKTLHLKLPFERRRNKVIAAYSGLDLVRHSLSQQD
ncbi:MAG: nicotinamide-nucleotide amidohydrolase family protein [Myxococcota bacterium]